MTGSLWAWVVLLLSAFSLAALLPFALHRLVLVGRLGLSAAPRERWPTPKDPLPLVTLQLPLYNEAEVVERLLNAVAELDYPADRLDLQILDDSTDETSTLVEALLPRLRERGHATLHLRREARVGFKAGALAAGLELAQGELLLILDADFIPGPTLIRELIPPFQDPGVGMVQARWDHLNASSSPLTQGQALLLDAHFALEQGGRYAAGLFFNFNGTAGMWRRQALLDAGGWSADTLTEDVDVSYRAQMAGWRFVYLDEVRVPSELPESVRALEIQQRRWAQGGVQTGLKILPALRTGGWPARIRTEATFHLLGHLAHPLTLLLGVLLLPSALARQHLGFERWILLDGGIFALATGSFLVFYGRAARTPATSEPPSFRQLLTRVPLALVLGIGLTAPVSGAVLRGLRKRTGDPFYRTPKGGAAGLRRYGVAAPGSSLILKAGLALWMLASAILAAINGFLPTLPLILVFATGWGWLALAELSDRRRGIHGG